MFFKYESLFNMFYMSYNAWMLYTPFWWLIVQRQGCFAPCSASGLGFCEQTDGMEILFNAHFSRTNTAVCRDVNGCSEELFNIRVAV